ncbi:MAG: hypothetical protein CL526_07675 [Aequorivita sp.]|nr:hypothetical protein [Aequorivita sp.]|tara:strand:+ start:1848 stop:2492 length:645 start_codon:yes stop_codon:yes gene_type:complete
MNSLKSLFVLVLLFSSINLFSQGSAYNRFSAEITTGVHVPLSPNDGVSRSNYVGFRQFQLSGRYMFNTKFGIKGHYGYNSFVNTDDKDFGVNYNRVGLEGVLNVGRLLNVNFHIRETFGLLFHTGVGVTLSNPTTITGTDRMGNIMAGFTGQIKINNDISLAGDMTYFRTIKQHYGYAGNNLFAGKSGVSGGFVNVSIGLIFNIGEERHHADWY